MSTATKSSESLRWATSLPLSRRFGELAPEPTDELVELRSERVRVGAGEATDLYHRMRPLAGSRTHPQPPAAHEQRQAQAQDDPDCCAQRDALAGVLRHLERRPLRHVGERDAAAAGELPRLARSEQVRPTTVERREM